MVRGRKILENCILMVVGGNRYWEDVGIGGNDVVGKVVRIFEGLNVDGEKRVEVLLGMVCVFL